MFCGRKQNLLGFYGLVSKHDYTKKKEITSSSNRFSHYLDVGARAGRKKENVRLRLAVESAVDVHAALVKEGAVAEPGQVTRKVPAQGK